MNILKKAIEICAVINVIVYGVFLILTPVWVYIVLKMPYKIAMLASKFDTSDKLLAIVFATVGTFWIVAILNAYFKGELDEKDDKIIAEDLAVHNLAQELVLYKKALLHESNDVQTRVDNNMKFYKNQKSSHIDIKIKLKK